MPPSKSRMSRVAIAISGVGRHRLLKVPLPRTAALVGSILVGGPG